MEQVEGLARIKKIDRNRVKKEGFVIRDNVYRSLGDEYICMNNPYLIGKHRVYSTNVKGR